MASEPRLLPSRLDQLQGSSKFHSSFEGPAPIQTSASSSSLAHAQPIEALAGLVERVTYHNAESGFCVLRIKARGQRDLVTVVGHAASIAVSEWVQMSGS